MCSVFCSRAKFARIGHSSGLHSPDPAFREKVNAICRLYRGAPKDVVVLSIDEKTGI